MMARLVEGGSMILRTFSRSSDMKMNLKDLTMTPEIYRSSRESSPARVSSRKFFSSLSLTSFF